MKTTSVISRLAYQFVIGLLVFSAICAFWWIVSRQSSPTPLTSATTVSVAGYPGPETDVPPALELTSKPFATATPMPEDGPRLGVISRLSDNPENRFQVSERPRFIQPATDGKTLVGITVNEGTEFFSGAITVLDLLTGENQKIATVTNAGRVAVSDKYIVWVEKDTLRVYERASGVQSEIKSGAAARNPSIDGSLLVWERLEEKTSPGFAIWMRDLATGEEKPVTKDTGNAEPLISGLWVVYKNLDDQDEITVGLYATNIETGETLAVGRLPKPDGTYQPGLYVVDEFWVAWNDMAGKPRLLLFNLDTRKTREVSVPSCQLGEHRGNPSHLVMSNNILLFRGCFQDLGYEIETGKFFSVPLNRSETEEAAFIGWAFEENKLVWASLLGAKGERMTQMFAASFLGK